MALQHLLALLLHQYLNSNYNQHIEYMYLWSEYSIIRESSPSLLHTLLHTGRGY